MARVSDLIQTAAKEIGTVESPPRSNRCKYNDWYYGRSVSGDAYPWCMVFVQWCCHKAGVALPMKTASCGALMRAAKSAGLWITGNYKCGDIVIYDFQNTGSTDHCGIVEKVSDGDLIAIEGNTGLKSNANGGEVMRRTRSQRLVIGAIRPAYEEEPEAARYQTVLECPEWSRETIRKLIRKGWLGGNGAGLDLSWDMVRILVILDRAGGFA